MSLLIIYIVYLLLLVLAILLAMRWYCRLTVGVCDCDQDMTGKTVLITGASAGIGKATALDLARRNARVLLACRNLKKSEKVKTEIISATGNTNVEVKHLDLESFDSVRKCAEDVLRTEKRLDVLINNAGILERDLHITKDGFDRCMQVNHLSHFLLTLLLLDLLKKSEPSRIINVSSMIYLISILDTDDIRGTKHTFLMRKFYNLYNRTKLANILFTRELASRLSGTGVTVNAVHPGLVKSNLMEGSYLIMRFLQTWLGKTVEEGAQTTIYAAVHPAVEKTTRKFFYGCQKGLIFGRAADKLLAKQLFEMSEKAVGVTFKACMNN